VNFGVEHRMRESVDGHQRSQPSADELRLAIDGIPGLIWTALPDGSIDFLNRRWCDYTGLTLDEAGGWGWKAAIHPDDLPRLLERWPSLLAAGEPGEIEARVRRLDGSFPWFVFRAVPLRDEDGQAIKWCGQATDIDHRRLADMMLAAENRVLDLVVKREPLPTVLDALCRFAEDATGALASVLLVAPDGKHLRAGAAPSLPPTFVEQLDGIPIVSGVSPSGLAALTGQQVIVANFEMDERWSAKHRELARSQGLKSCWSAPIRSLGGSIIGTFGLYHRELRSPTPADQSIIARFTHIASVAIERSNSEEAFWRIQSYHDKAQRLSRTGSFSWDVRTGELTWSNETYRIYGYDPAMKPTFDLARTRVHPDDVALFNETARRAKQAGNEIDFSHRLLMADGSVKWLHIASTAVRNEAGELIEYVGVVRDVTEERRHI